MTQKIEKMNLIVDRIITLGKDDSKPLSVIALKLMEEVGEFAECLNFELGYLQHKVMKEPLIGEAADIIQVVLAILGKHYIEKSSAEIIELLQEHLIKKTDKWESIVQWESVVALTNK